MPDYLSRYLDGEYENVWRELRELSLPDEALRIEAEDVAHETMNRIARNADRLAQRLEECGWESLTGKLRTTPNADDVKFIREVEEITGSAIPISLSTFSNIVGGIDFVWNYEADRHAPALCGNIVLEETDPLCVSPARHLTYLLDEWRDDPPNRIAGETWNLELAPDYLHKANISGGAPYGAALPAQMLDFVFQNERHNLMFIEYLRLAFRWSGFPGLEEHQGADVRAFVEAITSDLEPF